MIESTAMSEHDRVDALLPWYVNDTLDADERSAVQRHVATCDQCRESVAMLVQVQTELGKHAATPIVPEPRVDEFLESLDRRRSRSPRYRPRWTRWAAAASVGLLALLSAAYLAGRSGVPGFAVIYQTVTSSPTSASMDYVLALRFEPGTSEIDREKVFRDIGARDVTAAKENGEYRVIVQWDAATLEDVQEYTEGVTSMPGVLSVEIMAIQLPVRKDL